MPEPKKKYCAGCGIEIDLEIDQVVVADGQSFCIWCWSNDCCRVSRDVAESKQKEGESKRS